MTDVEFVSLAEKAKELGISEGAALAKAMSGQLDCYAFLRDKVAGTQEVFLPPWSYEKYPTTRWHDLGTPYDATGRFEHGTRDFIGGKRRRVPTPRYEVTGWVRLSPDFVATVYTRKEPISLQDHYVVIDDIDDGWIALVVVGSSEFLGVETGLVTRYQKIGPDEVMFMASNEVPMPMPVPERLDARREKSLLRIIRALDVMANLPKRGAATSVEKQLQELGFDGPNDETIRRTIEEARALKP